MTKISFNKVNFSWVPDDQKKSDSILGRMYDKSVMPKSSTRYPYMAAIKKETVMPFFGARL